MGDQRTETLPEYMIRVRRDIHRHPETAWTEYRTTALVARELEKWGYQVLLAEEVLDLESRSVLPAAGQLELAEMRAREEGVDPELMRRMAGGKTQAWWEFCSAHKDRWRRFGWTWMRWR